MVRAKNFRTGSRSDKYEETLYIPPLEGQSTFWTQVITRSIQDRDKYVCMGNFTSLEPRAVLHKGSDISKNSKVIFSIDAFARFTPTWRQLIGPNEISLITHPQGIIEQSALEKLIEMWLDENSYMVVATESNGQLVTQGGLSHGQWMEIGKPETAKEAADRLNEKFKGTLFQGRGAKLGTAPNYSVDPIWADTSLEVLPSWTTSPEACPFDQIHAGGPFRLEVDRDSLDDPASPLSFVDQVRNYKFGTRTYIKGAIFTDIDAEFGVEEFFSKNSKMPDYSGLYLERVEKQQN